MRKAIILFVVMAIAQWSLPLFTILEQERVLKEGVPLKFRTAPIDPHDPFRGEYVVLRFAIEDSSFIQPNEPYKHGEKVAVVLGEVNGEAAVLQVQHEEPKIEGPWLWVTVLAYDWQQDRFKLDLPFDRYYLEQGSGRRTEELVYNWDREAQPRVAHALVYVSKGNGVITDLLVDGRPIREIILEEREAYEEISEPADLPGSFADQ